MIRIKDEVVHKTLGDPAVVIDITTDGKGRQRFWAITKKDRGFIAYARVSDYVKTGVHVDDLDDYLGI